MANKASDTYVDFLANPRKRVPPMDALPQNGRQLKDAVERAYNLPKGCLGVKGSHARTLFKAAIYEAGLGNK